MAAEYDINLSNGNVLATLHPLETNGPDNTSTPRLIQEARPSYIIQAVVQGAPSFAVTGDFTDVFKTGFQFEVATGGSPALGPNDGTYTVVSSLFSSPNTVITVAEAITSATIHGSIIAHIFRLNSDVSYRFVAGFSFDVSSSAISGSPATPGEIDGTYTVTAIGPFFDGSTTIIPVAHDSIRDSVNIPIAVPYGEISYTIFDANTSLKLPGKGTPNYGEKIVENMVRMVEHFASDFSPELNTVIGGSPAGQPLIGQMWYNTTVGAEGYKHWDGTVWSSDVTVGDGFVNFTDIENTAGSPVNVANVYVTGSETNLPDPWMGTGSPALNLPGLVVWTDTDPLAGEPIFRVLSKDGNERLRVEHDGVVSTTNDLSVAGQILASDGTNVLPSISFSSNVDTGVYYGGGELRIVHGGNIVSQITDLAYRVTAVQLGMPDGTIATPGLAFNNGAPGLSSGLSRSAGNDVVLSSTGTEAVRFTSTPQILAPDGTAGAPSYSFTSDPDTGIMWFGNSMFFSVGGGGRMSVSSTEVNATVPYRQIGGSAAAPGYSFTGNEDNGMYEAGTDIIGFSTAGTETLRLNANGMLSVQGTTDYETLVLADDDIPNKKYVDDTVAGISWREPVLVLDSTVYANIAAAQTAADIGDTVDGETIIVGDRLLFTALTAGTNGIYVVSGSTGSWTFTDEDPTPNELTTGDATYIQSGTSAAQIYAYNGTDWVQTVGGAAGINVRYEAFESAGQTVFNLAQPYSIGTNRLLVYVDGVKQTLFDVGSPTTSDYEETDSTTVTFNATVPATSVVEFYAYDELTANAVAKREEQTGLTGNPNPLTFSTITYAVGGDNLLVFLNGQKMIKGTDYAELAGGTSIDWTLGATLVATDILEFYSSVPIVAGTQLGDIDNVSDTVPADGNILAYNSTSGNWEGVVHVAAKPGYVEYLSQSGTGSPLTLDFDTPSTGGTNDHNGTASLQVFVNGVYWIEGVNYTANVGSISLLAGSPNPIPAVFDLIIYEFA